MAGIKSIKHLTRDVIYHGLYSSGALTLMTKMQKSRGSFTCIMLLFHRIVDDKSVYLFKSSAMHCQVGDFRDEIAYLKRNYNIVGMDEAVDGLRSGRGFKSPTINITFDDGYRDNYTLAYPILKEYDVPATIYLTTSLIGTDGKTWTDRIEAALLGTEKEVVRHPFLAGGEEFPIGTKEGKRAASIKIAEALKVMPDETRKTMLDEFINKLGVNQRNGSSRMMLSWDEVREMAENGITMGCHTHSHPILSKMSLPDAKTEILISKQIVEEQLKMPVRHFAYPNGRAEDFSEDLRDYCREIGFASVASVIYGVNDPADWNAFCVKRVAAVSPTWKMAGVLTRLFMQQSRYR